MGGIIAKTELIRKYMGYSNAELAKFGFDLWIRPSTQYSRLELPS